MRISILTLFPEVFNFLENYSVLGRAINENKLSLELFNIREYSTNKHKKVDDYSYGGGPGMLMASQPIYDAIEAAKGPNSKVIYLSPQGKVLTQEKLVELSKEEDLIFLNGHYEGIDNRIIENYVDEEISIGDYVLTGGEIATMVLIDGISRLLPGVLSSDESFQMESHYDGILEYPQYTRPYDFMGHKVPDILLSGDHKKVELYRRSQALRATFLKRPDLLKKVKLSREDEKLIEEIKNSLKGGL